MGLALTQLDCLSGAPLPHYSRIMVEVAARTIYSMVWHDADLPPLLHQSRGYVVHQCDQGRVSQAPPVAE